jgi:hypothetical protein
MSSQKTRDGCSLQSILKFAAAHNIQVRAGTKHPYMLTAESMRPCPVARSSHAQYMITPWLAQVTGYKKRDIYETIQ